jgi:hypothetical protein
MMILNLFLFIAIVTFWERKKSHDIKSGGGGLWNYILFLARNSCTEWSEQVHCCGGEKPFPRIPLSR